MNLYELRTRYNKAHETYLKYKDVNKTNNTEALFIPEALKCLQAQFSNGVIVTTPDCFLNYIGVDFIVAKEKALYTIDLKVCQYLHNTEVLIDAYKHNKNGNWFCALDNKANDCFMFINADNIIIVSAKSIRSKIPPIEDCFFMKRDVYKTTKKAVIDVKECRKLIFSRNL